MVWTLGWRTLFRRAGAAIGAETIKMAVGDIKVRSKSTLLFKDDQEVSQGPLSRKEVYNHNFVEYIVFTAVTGLHMTVPVGAPRASFSTLRVSFLLRYAPRYLHCYAEQYPSPSQLSAPFL